MPVRSGAAARCLLVLLSLGIVAGCFFLSQPAALSDPEAADLAARFRFEPTELPDISGLPHNFVRAVHPSLRHTAGMISFVGAAVALGDLDGDGLPNDLVHVDPRTDQVTVAPVPGTADRFKPFL